MSRRPLIPPSPSEAAYGGAADATALEGDDPIALFENWLRDASARETNDPNAMTLATVDGDGLPDARMVLLKGVDARGFVFYTNGESAKGDQLAAQPRAALVFHWKSLRRQVRVRGPVSSVDDAEADAYFASRARSAQIGAWASEQSRPIPDALAIERRVAEFGLKFGLGQVPRPSHWRGYRLSPRAIEFWRDRPFRLHERRRFTRSETGWTVERLYP